MRVVRSSLAFSETGPSVGTTRSIRFDLLRRLHRSVQERLSDHGADFLLAIALFVASSIFFYLFARLSIEYGGSDVSLAGACTKDCDWYATIIQDGYHLEPVAHPKRDAANWAFFPAFPLAAKLISTLGGYSPDAALVITGKLFFLGCIFVFLVAARRELGLEARYPAGILVAFNPYLVYAHAGYSEPLYFLLTAMAFVAAGSRRWVMAGLAAGALSATRLVGALFGIALLIEIWRSGALANRRSWPTLLLALLLCPLGLALFMAYLHVHLGDALAFKHVQVAWGREISNPLQNLADGLALRLGGWSVYFTLCAAAAIGVSASLAWRGRYGHAAFLLGAILVPLSTGLISLPRYVFWQFPFLFGVLEIVSKSKLTALGYVVFSSATAGLMVVAWFTNKPFVW